MKHSVAVSGGFAGAEVHGKNAALSAKGAAPGGEESEGPGGAGRLIAFGSLKALSGETLEACLERHSASAGRGAPRLAQIG